ncbi:MAG: hypothetical protein ACRC3Y_06570 [Romboutsia sp.]|uniref:hypothetical protein n=1 Tax=Romboutsia sp. TaxID=1965302 RepID=UPI003F37BDB6
MEEKNIVIDNCINEIIKIENNKECYTIKELSIDGEILKSYGYEGKEIGEMLNYILQEVINKPELNKKEELIKLLETVEKQHILNKNVRMNHF